MRILLLFGVWVFLPPISHPGNATAKISERSMCTPKAMKISLCPTVNDDQMCTQTSLKVHAQPQIDVRPTCRGSDQ
eukprot:1158190-Pelagomonas_calceolata.AAC.3